MSIPFEKISTEIQLLSANYGVALMNQLIEEADESYGDLPSGDVLAGMLTSVNVVFSAALTTIIQQLIETTMSNLPETNQDKMIVEVCAAAGLSVRDRLESVTAQHLKARRSEYLRSLPK